MTVVESSTVMVDFNGDTSYWGYEKTVDGQNVDINVETVKSVVQSLYVAINMMLHQRCNHILTTVPPIWLKFRQEACIIIFKRRLFSDFQISEN